MKKLILAAFMLGCLATQAQIYTPNGAIQGSSGNNNVGIGTTNPGSKLQVNSDNSQSALSITGKDPYIHAGLTFTDNNQATAGKVKTWAIWAGTDGGAWISGLGFVRYDAVNACAGGICDLSLFLHDNGNVGIGTGAPLAKLDVAGNIKIADGTQGAGKVLTSDASGLASWKTPTISNVLVTDTRSVVTGPQTGNRQVRFDFLGNGTDGLNDGGIYHGVMTFQQWNDASGGGTRQLAFTDNDNLWIRGSGNGLTAYNAWKKVIATSSTGTNRQLLTLGLQAEASYWHGRFRRNNTYLYSLQPSTSSKVLYYNSSTGEVDKARLKDIRIINRDSSQKTC